jgi:hypothetical protein
MPPAQTDILDVIESKAHLRHDKRIRRQLEYDLVAYDALKVHYGRYSEIEIVAPSADNRVTPHDSMSV